MSPTFSQRLARHLRANVVAYLALFAALTLGPAWAATKTAPKNSVTSKSIKDGQVMSQDIGDGQVTGGDIADGQVTGADVDESTLKTVGYVGSGPGLTGGPITDSGTLSLQSCPSGQLLKSNGSGYACGPDIDTNSGGDITDVIAGNGLSGGNTSGAATLNMPNCGAGQVMTSNGFNNGYLCASLTRDDQISTATATPSVCCSVSSMVSLNFPTATAVTGLSGGVPGQIVTLNALNTNVTIADGGNFFLSANWTPNNSDTLTLIASGSGSTWNEIARSANSAATRPAARSRLVEPPPKLGLEPAVGRLVKALALHLWRHQRLVGNASRLVVRIA